MKLTTEEVREVRELAWRHINMLQDRRDVRDWTELEAFVDDLCKLLNLERKEQSE